MKTKLLKTLALGTLLVTALSGCTSLSGGISYQTNEKEFTIQVAKNQLYFWNRTWPLTDEHYFTVKQGLVADTWEYDSEGLEENYRVIVKNVYYEQYTEESPVLNYTVSYKEKIKLVDDTYDSISFSSFKVEGVMPMTL